mmetsp:Transcript_15889/g.40517  ORF Transcript_15889/g.40517 Transcript_15889/m.40517 type:complete len:229 (-) Transcript_15889:336-1022(-)
MWVSLRSLGDRKVEVVVTTSARRGNNPQEATLSQSLEAFHIVRARKGGRLHGNNLPGLPVQGVLEEEKHQIHIRTSSGLNPRLVIHSSLECGSSIGGWCAVGAPTLNRLPHVGVVHGDEAIVEGTRRGLDLIGLRAVTLKVTTGVEHIRVSACAAVCLNPRTLWCAASGSARRLTWRDPFLPSWWEEGSLDGLIGSVCKVVQPRPGIRNATGENGSSQRLVLIRRDGG